MHKPVLSKLESTDVNASRTGIASLTCDRVELFTRSLVSIADRLNIHDHIKPAVVFDDSIQSDIRDKKRQITLEVHDRYGIDTLYIGLEEKNAFLDVIKESLPPEYAGSLYYLLSGDPLLKYIKASGANRNAVLTAFAGRRFISIDDDMIIKPCVLTGSSTAVTQTRGKIIHETGFFPSIKNIDTLAQPFTDDPFRYFDSYTGVSVEDVLPGSGHGRIMATMAGYYGGRWSQRPYIMLLSEGRLRDQLFKSRTDYKEARYKMLGCMQSPEIVIYDTPDFWGGAIGIDATTIVPPFESLVRCSDNLWAELLQYCDKNYMIASLPFAFYHDWTEKPPFTEKDFKKIGADLGINMTLLFSAVAGKNPCPDGADPFACFGKALVELSGMPHNKWMDMCRSIWYGYVGSITDTLKELLVKYDRKPSYWAKDVDVFLDRIRSQSMDVASFVPRELHAAGSPEEAGRVHRKMLYDYGMLLVHWSSIWNEICRINAEGRGLLGEMYNTLQ